MNQTHWFPSALMFVLLVALLAVPATTSAGNPVGGMFLIRDETVDTKDPAIAYNSHDQEYLVVFWNDRPGCDDIRAERVARDGRLLGGVWVANGCGAERRYPDVAYNSQANEYLVVWEEDDMDIRGQRVSATGGLTGGAFDIALGNIGATYCVGPAIAYASTENKYLVAFEWRDASGYRIMAQALNSDGSAWGTAFDVEPYSLVIKAYPDLAYNRLRNEFLVVWQQWNPSQFDIRGRRVKMSGSAGPLGSAFWFSCDPSRSDDSPAVAAVPRSPDGQYLVAWEYWSSANNYDIWAQRVAGEGTLEGNAFRVYYNPFAQDELRPAVAGSESNQQYLAAWAMSPAGYPGSWSQAVLTSGALVDVPTVVGGVDVDNAAVAAGPVGGFLIALQDKLAGNYDIYGRLWGNRLYLPLVLKNR
jgi:hypothetical protein